MEQGILYLFSLIIYLNFFLLKFLFFYFCFYLKFYYFLFKKRGSRGDFKILVWTNTQIF